MRIDSLIRRLTLVALLLCLGVVVFGAYVRLTAAGLGCPDWPGCYGHFMPADSVPDAGKAWREMIHRYAASTLGLIIVAIAALAIATRRQRIVSVGYALALLGIVMLQGLLGMLTVTWSLKPLIVTLHLLFGLTTLSLLWWLWRSLCARRPHPSLPRFAGEGDRARFVPPPPRAGEGWGGGVPRKAVLIGLIALIIQIALGGWTSSNYAAVACPDLPKCQGQWWPHTDYKDAFVLWRGLGVNYEGGVLESPARVAIHLTHRLGAIVASLALLLAAITVLRRPLLAPARPSSIAVLLALALQLSIGVAMVMKAFPLPLATAHNAGAAVLLLATLALYRQTTRFG